MRLFVAIDLPDNVKEILRGIQKILPDAKMTAVRDFHLTLKFLGECDGVMRKKVEEELKHVKFQSFNVALGNIGIFGGERNPRVVWVKVEAPLLLKETADEIEDRMVRLGFEKENRFMPHLTLSRMKFVRDPWKFAEELKRITAPEEKFAVSEFCLFKSRLSSAGALYTKLKTFPSVFPHQ